MYNIFAPFVLILSFFNHGARWMGQTFLPLYFYNTERVFIPPLQNSVSFNKIWPLAEMVTYPELDLDRELIYSSLEFAQSVPDFKTCFPEIWEDIVDLCSGDSTFISEYQYSVMALRIFNCLHHRSLGIEEIDFEFIHQRALRVILYWFRVTTERNRNTKRKSAMFGRVKLQAYFSHVTEDYIMYLAMMTHKERILYHEMYNVARGLCLNEKHDRAIIDVRDTAQNIENSVERYLNRVQRIKTYLATSIKANIKKTKKKQDVQDTFINETGRLVQRVKQKSEEKYTKYITVMKNVIDESNSCSMSVETSLNVVAKNFRKIGLSLEREKSLKRPWINFTQEYSRKTVEMERKIASIEMKLGKIYKYKLK